MSAMRPPHIPIGPNDTVSKGTRLRCAFEVTAGLYPGNVIDEFTRRWLLTSEAWESEDGARLFSEYSEAAHNYAKDITNPRAVNSVRVDFIWL